MDCYCFHLELPVYGTTQKGTTDHSTHSIWVKPETVSKIEPTTWERSPSSMGVDTRDPKDRPNVCLVQSGDSVMMVAWTAEEAVERVNQKVNDNLVHSNKQKGSD